MQKGVCGYPFVASSGFILEKLPIESVRTGRRYNLIMRARLPNDTEIHFTNSMLNA